MTEQGTVADGRPPSGTIENQAGTPQTRHSGIILAIIAVTYLMISVDATVVNIALPKIQEDLGFSRTSLAWVINAYTVVFGGLLLFGGRIGDILGKRRMLTLGTLIFTAASLVGGLAQSPGLLIAARAVQGLGAALAAPSTMSLIATNFEEGALRTKALSVYSATAGAGGSIGLILGGVLTDWASWRWVLFINVPIGLAIAVLAPRYIREPVHQRNKVDIVGTVTATLGMVALVYAFIRVPEHGWSDGLTIGSYVLAGVLLAAFLVVETRVDPPILPLRLFASRNRSGAYLNVLLLTASMMGLFFFLAQYVQDVMGYSPARSGFAFLPMTLGMFATVTQVATLLKKFGAKRLMVAGAALMAGAFVWLTQLTETSAYWTGVFGPLLMFGVGMGLSFMPMNMTVLAGVDPKDAGAASGSVQTMMQLGGALGLAVLVTVFGTAGKNAADEPRGGASPVEWAHHVFTEGMQSAFVAGTAFLVFALLVALVVIKSPAKRKQSA
ncbi:MFS transporter [Streptomyces sp. NPDC020747]|uniref:MFS transporter n=1 Tax=Streptomyces sp. NPDC020747 TaxID=3365086 RepID=UPI0037AE4659